MSRKTTKSPAPVRESVTNTAEGAATSPVPRLVGGAAAAVALALTLALLRPATPPGADVRGTAPDEGGRAADAEPPLPPEVWHEAFPLTPVAIHLTPDEEKAPPDRPGMAAASALARALEPYRAAEYQQAAVALEGVLLDHPAELRAALYLGVSRLYIDEPQAAIEALRQAQQSTNPDVLADAEWYILVGIARLREPGQAEADAKAVCARGGPTAERPCRAVEALARARAAGVARGAESPRP